MTLFAGASALISILTQGSDALTLAACLEQDRDRLQLFLRELGFRLVSIGEIEIALAIDANARFGNGRHLAKLNMGDCYAYTCARANHATLLFKGGDFTKTDIEPAARPL